MSETQLDYVLTAGQISAIFADLILQLLTCEGRVPGKPGHEAQEVLGTVSLVFSCLFMVWQPIHNAVRCADGNRLNS